MMLHCASQSEKCFLDSDCRSLMLCPSQCGESNQTCVFECFYSYENQISDNFMKCAITDHACITLAPPKPPVICKRPTQVVKNFSLDMLEGSWYTVKGLNPMYDCYDCEITRFAQNMSKSIVNAIEKFQVHTTKGTTVMRYVNETATVSDQQDVSVLNYTSLQMGLYMITERRILDVGENGEYLFMYYCGFISNDYHTEGAAIFSKTPQLSSESWTRIQKVGSSFGFDMYKFCSPKPDNCIA
ncbi:hypothetical protein FSP39_012373 [Pinctada imbricata]|uniref:VDE lipocalin domain-containing protein n=1 Tax=Pinctada imbricata TaxID=66713 RepID=A0AA88Y4B0_PINIB|nr:hypothetical protein FSP39_012373 [Pinctada imbricata]